MDRRSRGSRASKGSRASGSGKKKRRSTAGEGGSRKSSGSKRHRQRSNVESVAFPTHDDGDGMTSNYVTGLSGGSGVSEAEVLSQSEGERRTSSSGRSKNSRSSRMSSASGSGSRKSRGSRASGGGSRRSGGGSRKSGGGSRRSGGGSRRAGRSSKRVDKNIIVEDEYENAAGDEGSEGDYDEEGNEISTSTVFFSNGRFSHVMSAGKKLTGFKGRFLYAQASFGYLWLSTVVLLALGTISGGFFERDPDFGEPPPDFGEPPEDFGEDFEDFDDDFSQSDAFEDEEFTDAFEDFDPIGNFALFYAIPATGLLIYNFIMLVRGLCATQYVPDTSMPMAGMVPMIGRRTARRRDVGMELTSVEPRSMAVTALVEVLCILVGVGNPDLNGLLSIGALSVSVVVLFFRIAGRTKIALEFGDGIGHFCGALYYSKALFLILVLSRTVSPWFAAPYGLTVWFLSLYGAVDSRPMWDLFNFALDAGGAYYVGDTQSLVVVLAVTLVELTGDILLVILRVPSFTGGIKHGFVVNPCNFSQQAAMQQAAAMQQRGRRNPYTGKAGYL